MNKILFDEARFWLEIRNLEEKRDEHSKYSAEYIELDVIIKTNIDIFHYCTSEY